MKEKVLVKLFEIVCMLAFAFLCFYSLVQTGYSPFDLSSEFISFKKDNWLLNLCFMVLLLVVLWAVERFVSKKKLKINTRVLAIVASVLSLGISLFWVVGSNIAPISDQKNILYYAWAFNEGDFSGFNKGKYVATCPHQLGMISVMRIMYALLKNRPNPYAGFQMLSVLCVGVIVYVGYELVRRISKKNAFVELVYLFLAVTCFPLYAYTPFVYGEIPSTALLFVAAWLLLSALDNMKWYKAVLLALCCTAAILFRQNSLIVIIGFFILLVVKLIQRFAWQYVALIVAIVIGYLGSSWSMDVLYGKYYQEDGKAIPSILYIAMGTNWEQENPGWFTGYNYTVFFENDCDQEAASRVAYEDLSAFGDKCWDDKAYAVSFLKEKLLSQWNEPMFHSLFMNQNVQYEQFPIIENVYYGSLRNVVESSMNLYQLVVYIGILGLLVLSVRKDTGIETYTLLIGVLGGFFFSIIWEGKTRYVFPYYIMMLPYAALGWQKMVAKINRNVKKV